jgi:hypothetical protein
MAQLKSSIVQGNLTASGSILASKLSILNGGSNQILMANGGLVDIGTLTPLTSHNALVTTVANVSAVANAADALSKTNASILPNKYDKAGGTISGNVSITGTLGVTGKATFNGGVEISGSAASKPLKVRGIVGRESDSSNEGDLYLQYENSATSHKVYFGGSTYYISNDGSSYNGTSFAATKLTTDAGAINNPVYFTGG